MPGVVAELEPGVDSTLDEPGVVAELEPGVVAELDPGVDSTLDEPGVVAEVVLLVTIVSVEVNGQ